MKKTKICNIIMMIINLIVIVLSTGIGINKVKIFAGTLLEDSGIINNIIVYSISSIMLVFANIIMLVLNRKNKEIRFYYLLLIIPFLAKAIDSSFLWYSKSIDFIYLIMAILLTTLICIYNIKNRQGKMKAVIPILTLIFAVILVMIAKYLSDYIIIENYYIPTCILSVVLILTFIIFIIRNKNVEELSNRNIVIAILCCIIVLASIIGERMCYWYIQEKADVIVAKIERRVRMGSADTDETYIPVCKNSKWGYINQKGEQVIECKYDHVGNFYKLKFENMDNYLYIAGVKDGKNYKLISYNDEVIWNLNNKEISRNNIESGDAVFILAYQVCEMVEKENNSAQMIIEEINLDDEYSPYIEIIPNKNGVYKVETNKVNYEITEENKVGYNKIRSIVKSVQESQTIEKEIDVIFDYVDESKEEQCIRVYSDGYLPYYDFENNKQGYYDKNFEIVAINENYQILDIKNDILLARKLDYDGNEERIIAINLQNGEVNEYNGIITLKNGYIVKNLENESILLDENLEQISNKYDLIDTTYLKMGILITMKINSTDIECELIDVNGNKLSELKYESIGNSNFKNTPEVIAEYKDEWHSMGYLCDLEKQQN